MKNVLVSICIPAYNAERFIAETLESALHQDYPHLEIVVSDDCSTDRTPEIVASYQARGVRWIRQAENLGMTRNMNAAIRASQGKYVCELDSDDILEPTFVSSLIGVMEANSRVSFAHCAARLIDLEGNFIGYERSIHGSFIRRGLDEWPRYVFGPRANHMLLIRRTAFDAVGGYDERFVRSQDWKLERDLLRIGDVFYNDAVLYSYRVHSVGKINLRLLRGQTHLLHLEDMEQNWPANVPGKTKLLLKARRHFANALIMSAAHAESSEAEELLKLLPLYGNFLKERIFAQLVHKGGSKIIRSYYQHKLSLRQIVKNHCYKNA